MANDTLSLKVITGSTREGQFSSQAAAWVKNEMEKIAGFTVEVLDLAEYNLPFFDQAVSPSYKQAPYPYENVELFAAKIAEGDAFIMIVPEYNHAPTAVLKNAIDWVYQEWNDKVISYVGYGSVGGARAIAQLRDIAVELRLASVHDAINITGNDFFPVKLGGADANEMFAKYADKLPGMAEQLKQWGTAFKTMRQTNA